MNKIYSILLTCVLSLTLANCGNDEPSGAIDKDIIGEWHQEFTSVSDKEEMEFNIYIFYSDASFKRSWKKKDTAISYPDYTGSQSGKFSVSGNKIYFKQSDGGETCINYEINSNYTLYLGSSLYKKTVYETSESDSSSVGQGDSGSYTPSNHHYPCKSCDETGNCWRCHGSGKDPVTGNTCNLCHGSKKCQICNGKGWVII